MELDYLLLAAGFGTRLLPLTLQIPKVLLPINGLPLLDYHITRALSGPLPARRVVVNGHHLADQIGRHLGHHAECERLSFSLEREILGTGGAIHHARDQLASDPFAVINADALFPAPIDAARRFHQAGGHLITLILTPNRLHPNVLVRDGLVSDILRDGLASAGLTYTGCQIVSRAVTALLPRATFHDIRDTYRTLIERGQLGAFVAPEDLPLLDIGTPARYLGAHRSCGLEESARHGFPSPRPDDPLGLIGNPLPGYGFVSARAAIDASAEIRESVVLDGAQVAPRSNIRRSIIGPGVRVEGRIVDRMVTIHGSLKIAGGSTA